MAKTVSIRTETDPERLKAFTPEMLRIRREWQEAKAANGPDTGYEAAMADISGLFRSFAK